MQYLGVLLKLNYTGLLVRAEKINTENCRTFRSSAMTINRARAENQTFTSFVKARKISTRIHSCIDLSGLPEELLTLWKNGSFYKGYFVRQQFVA